GTHGAAAATLTDAEAKAVLEAEHTAQSIFRLPVGTFSVVKKGGRYAGPDAITETRRLEYRAWSRAGLVRIEDDPSWNAFQDGKGDMALYNLQKEGVTTRMKITPTAMAAPFRDKKNPQQYNIPMGNLVIARIEDNVEKNIGADQYRVITFSGKINFLPITAEYFKQYFAKAVSQEGRAIYLIKYEPAAQRWTRLAADWADPSGEFKTKNVQSKLLELSYRKP
ncbi:MAG: hypothetical protein KAX84_04475, partial [Burkholderiales bacterium]|nr:hypothetical protein [Burkholderiales bacterium]